MIYVIRQLCATSGQQAATVLENSHVPLQATINSAKCLPLSKMPNFSRKDFLRSYDFPLHPAQDFCAEGVCVSYAPGHPRAWGGEEDGFDFLKDIKAHFSDEPLSGGREKVG